MTDITEKQLNETTHIFLQPGELTPTSGKVKELSLAKIRGEGKEYLEDAIRWIATRIDHNTEPESKRKIFRKRNSNTIIEDRVSTGCTDDALVFISLARVKGIPTKYVEAVSKDSDGIDGHVFAECFINDKWITVDPANKTFLEEFPTRDYDIVAIGIDPVDTNTTTVDNIIVATSDARRNRK